MTPAERKVKYRVAATIFAAGPLARGDARNAENLW
jgi:hypothetical protein